MTTYNSAAFLPSCLESLFEQDYPELEIVVVDNGSSDGTGKILQRYQPRIRVFWNRENRGFAAGQNLGMRKARGQWLLSLNPDVIASRDFVSKLVEAGRQCPTIGAVCGKLLRWRPGASPERSDVIDSTGIYFLRNLRHLDRGAEERDRGQYEREELVVGATGAAALYRRAMVEEVSVEGEFFDEDFFAYREDADAAWRAQLLGWGCLYTPRAVAWHVRRVTPERFHDLPEAINRHSIKNRFLMRAKNASPGLCLRLLVPVTWRDLQIVGYCALFRPRLLSGLGVLWRRRKEIRKKREWIQSRRKISEAEMARWFCNRPRSYLFSAAGAGQEGK